MSALKSINKLVQFNTCTSTSQKEIIHTSSSSSTSTWEEGVDKVAGEKGPGEVSKVPQVVLTIQFLLLLLPLLRLVINSLSLCADSRWGSGREWKLETYIL